MSEISLNLSPELEDLFHQVADLGREQRARFFLEHAIDPEIRQPIEELLAHDDSTDGGLASLVQKQARSSFEFVAQLNAGQLCGRYRLFRLLGRGGMGEVWLADRADGLVKRQIALKLPSLGIHGAQFAERSHRERDILAGLVHPGIARLYDAGLTDQGRPFLALEFVEGVSLSSYCDERHLPIRDRLKLFLQILSAVQHAHSRLVIHRDLKPSNILVTGDGEVKLLDFGIAKLMNDGEALETELTQLGGRALTLHYASPEQISGHSVTTTSDVFSLGTILCELLSGERPFVPRRDSRWAMEEAILFEEPRRPSQAICSEAQAQARSTSIRKLKAQLKGDLDLIVLKALQRNPLHRYATADAFRADIERYLAAQPVLAQPESAYYRIKKFVYRHKLPVASTFAMFLALAGGLSVALWQARIARNEARTSEAVQTFTEDIFRANSLEQPDPVKARQTTARQLLDIGARKVSSSLNNAPEAKLRMLETLVSLYVDLGLDEQAASLQRQRVQLTKSIYGKSSKQTAHALIELASTVHATRSADEEEGVLLEAKAILDKNQDFNSPNRALLLSYLAEHDEGTNLKRSLAEAKEAVALYRKFPPSGEFSDALYALGVAHLSALENTEAEAALREAIAVSRKVDGDPNSRLARYYAFAATAEVNQMAYAPAERDLRLALKESLALGNEDDLDTFESESRLGMFLAVTSRMREGLAYLQKAKAVCLRTKGLNDPFYTPQVMVQYGLALQAYGRPEEALDNVFQAAENRGKNRPGTHILSRMLDNEALVLVDLGRYEKAARLLNEAATIRQKVGVKPDANYLVPRTTLLIALGKSEEALDFVEHNYGPVPNTAVLSLEVGNNLEARAKIALLKHDGKTAIALAERAMKAAASSPAQPYLRAWKARMMDVEGQGYLLEHDAAKAKPFLEEAVKDDLEMLDANSPTTAAAKATLGKCYLDLGEKPKARKLLVEAQAMLRAHKELSDAYTRPASELAKQL